MTTIDKQKAVRTSDDFIASVASMLAETEDGREAIIVQFPEPVGLGSDGTLWTDEEHRQFYRRILDKARWLLTPRD